MCVCVCVCVCVCICVFVGACVRVCACMHVVTLTLPCLLVSSSHAMQRLTFLTDSIQSIIVTNEMGHNLDMQHDNGSKSPLGLG